MVEVDNKFFMGSFGAREKESLKTIFQELGWNRGR